MYEQQRADHPEEMKGVKPPKEANTKSILQSQGSAKAKLAKKAYEDPGLNHLTNLGLTKDQLKQALEYGLANGAPRPSVKAREIAIPLHWTIAAGLTILARSNGALSFELPSLYVYQLPSTEGSQDCKSLCISFDEVPPPANTCDFSSRHPFFFCSLLAFSRAGKDAKRRALGHGRGHSPTGRHF